MRATPGRRTRNTETGSRTFCRRQRVRRMMTGVVALATTVLTLSGCVGGNPNLQTAPPKPKPTTTASTANPALPASTASTQQAVLAAWESAEQQLYAYMDEPPAPLRADLMAGETTTDLFPKLANFYTATVLQSEYTFLFGLKMGLLNGPTSYNLGHPSVTALTASTATVAGCYTDTGSTTATGQPAPATLDGGKGGGQGTWSLQLIAGAWEIASYSTTSVKTC